MLFKTLAFVLLAFQASAFTVNRRDFVAGAIAGGASVIAKKVNAKTAFTKLNEPADNEVVKEQVQVIGYLDVNNSPVADYMKYPGLYPTLAGKIANNGPYKSVEDVLKLPGLTNEEVDKLKFYKARLVATEPSGLDTMRGRDPYRTSFNAFKQVKLNTVGSN